MANTNTPILILAFLLLVGGATRAQSVDFDSANAVSGQPATVKVQVDVTVPAGQSATMRFVVKDDAGVIVAESATESVTSGSNQEFTVLFDESVSTEHTIQVILEASGGGSDTASTTIDPPS